VLIDAGGIQQSDQNQNSSLSQKLKMGYQNQSLANKNAGGVH
jgi:hypothetical protein